MILWRNNPPKNRDSPDARLSFMKILTLNTWSDNGPFEIRRRLILSELKQLKPDVLCLQEVFQAGFADEIKTACQFQNVYANFTAGLVILSRLPFESMDTVVYNTLSPSEYMSRHAILVNLKSDTQSFWIVNTHLSWRLEDDKIRAKQAEELLECVKALEGPVILTGDFNSLPDSEPVSKLKQAGFHDLFDRLHPKEKGFTWDNDRNPYLKNHSILFPNRRIDFILPQENLLAQLPKQTCRLAFAEPDAAGHFASDHFGLMADLHS